MSQLPLQQLGNGFLNFAEKLQAGLGDPGDHDTPVLRASLPPDELTSFQAIEQPGDVRLGRNHPARRFRAGQTIPAGAPQNAEHVVLRRCELVLLQKVREPAQKELPGAAKVQKSLFFARSERFALPNFLCQFAAHKPRIHVITTFVKPYFVWLRTTPPERVRHFATSFGRPRASPSPGRGLLANMDCFRIGDRSSRKCSTAAYRQSDE